MNFVAGPRVIPDSERNGRQCLVFRAIIEVLEMFAIFLLVHFPSNLQ